MKNLTAEKFYKDFLKIVKDLTIEEYKRKSPLTSFFKEKIKEYIVACGYGCSNEYYKIDAVAWEQLKNDGTFAEESKKHNLTLSLWDLKMAVEYENDKKTWISELIKLSFIKCPLKVIITYNYCNKRDDELLGDKAKIAFGKNLLTRLGNLNNDEEYLIIFGNACADKGKGTYEEFGYRGYVINGDNIKEL